MENHPIPQQISSYQFRLVGDMTLKQFFQVGGGALIAIVLYTSGLPVYIKWPLIIVSFLLGVALAFFPIEDRPLSKWLVLFAKSIYSPTLYVWMKNFKEPQYFQLEGANAPVTDTNIPQPAPVIMPQTTKEAQPLDQKEEQFLSQVTKALNPSAPVAPQPVVAQQIAPAPPVDIPQPTATYPEVSIPQTETLAVPQAHEAEEIFIPTATKQQEDITAGSEISPMVGEKTQNAMDVQFVANTSAPSTPTTPNVIVGQVIDSVGKIVESAILEIKDEEGRPVRALRSNKLGHFMIVTPLVNGTYEITTEKDGLVFEPLTLPVTGEIIFPITIKAK